MKVTGSEGVERKDGALGRVLAWETGFQVPALLQSPCVTQGMSLRLRSPSVQWGHSPALPPRAVARVRTVDCEVSDTLEKGTRQGLQMDGFCYAILSAGSREAFLTVLQMWSSGESLAGTPDPGYS